MHIFFEFAGPVFESQELKSSQDKKNRILDIHKKTALGNSSSQKNHSLKAAENLLKKTLRIFGDPQGLSTGEKITKD
jgi:hypothetical protein